MASMLMLCRRNPWVPLFKNTQQFSVNSQHLKSLYDSLGLTPKATQSDIKTAYYKLSKIHHPDKNEGSQEAADKFRDITEAYEVLGNLGLRKRYDKGILHRSDKGPSAGTDAEKADDSYSRFYESRQHRSRPPTVSGKSPIYDFDEWTQAHYGASFARRQAAKREYAKYNEWHTYHRRFQRLDLVCFCVFVVLMAFFWGAMPWDNYDVVKSKLPDTPPTKSNFFPEE
ncbi:dnaJ homolog subfamily C member 30, mitochondrial [Bacillus rossius redtenbacheri]|uniref:dnaJ homolog subfamily C member 30, mitochondrial n=1 Tax=Bacillus rossius redtenbacheri TaxID=93214 RepID=UPI002FDE4DD8